MGSAVSVTNSTMNENEVKEACGDKFDNFFYSALKNEEGFIFTTDLNRLLTSSVELEVCRLFLTYSPKNNMNEQTFLTLLRDAKLLNKGLFSVKDAEKLFFKIKTEHEPPTSRGISYKTWRHHALVEISSLKGIELEKLLLRLSHCEDLIEAIAQKREDQKVIDKSPSETKPVTPEVKPSPTGLLGIRNVFTDAQRDACVKIQSAQRTKTAVIKAQRKKEIQSISSTSTSFSLPTIEAGEPSEIALVQLFHSYTPPGELSKKGFLSLLKDAKVFDKELTIYDAEFMFDRVKAKCSTSSSPFQDQVIHNKRLKYQPFRLLLIPDVAGMKNQSVDRFVQVLVNAIPLAPMDGENTSIGETSRKNTSNSNSATTTTPTNAATSSSTATRKTRVIERE